MPQLNINIHKPNVKDCIKLSFLVDLGMTMFELLKYIINVTDPGLTISHVQLVCNGRSFSLPNNVESSLASFFERNKLTGNARSPLHFVCCNAAPSLPPLWKELAGYNNNRFFERKSLNLYIQFPADGHSTDDDQRFQAMPPFDPDHRLIPITELADSLPAVGCVRGKNSI